MSNLPSGKPSAPMINRKSQAWNVLNIEASAKIAVFNDGQNLHYASRALGFDVDFKMLLTEIESVSTRRFLKTEGTKRGHR
jgi:hypothetical protein